MNRKTIFLVLFVLSTMLFLQACGSSAGINIISPSPDMDFSLKALPQSAVMFDVLLKNKLDHDVMVRVLADGKPLNDCLVPAGQVKKCDKQMPVVGPGEHTLYVSYEDGGSVVTRSTTVTWMQSEPAFSANAVNFYAFAIVLIIVFFGGLAFLAPQLGWYRHINLHRGTETQLMGISTRTGNAASSAIQTGRYIAEAQFAIDANDPKVLEDVSYMHQD